MSAPIHLLKGLSLDRAKTDFATNQRTIFQLMEYVKQANQQDIAKLTNMLGEEDINFPLLVFVEQAIQQRAKQQGFTTTSLLTEELVSAAVLWEEPQKGMKKALRENELMTLLQDNPTHNDNLARQNLRVCEAYVNSAQGANDFNPAFFQAIQKCNPGLESAVNGLIQGWAQKRGQPAPFQLGESKGQTNKFSPAFDNKENVSTNPSNDEPAKGHSRERKVKGHRKP